MNDTTVIGTLVSLLQQAGQNDEETVRYWLLNSKTLGDFYKNKPESMDSIDMIELQFKVEQAFHAIEFKDDGTLVAWTTNHMHSKGLSADLDNVLSLIGEASGYTHVTIKVFYEVQPDTDWEELESGTFQRATDPKPVHIQVLSASRNGTTRYQVKVNGLLMEESDQVWRINKAIYKHVGIEE